MSAVAFDRVAVVAIHGADQGSESGNDVWRHGLTQPGSLGGQFDHEVDQVRTVSDCLDVRFSDRL